MGTSALALLLLLLCLVAEERVQSRVVTSSKLLVVESRDYNANDTPVCVPGNCTKCWVYETIKVCLIASITTVDVIRLTLVAQGNWIIARGDVTAASHGPLCVTDVPGADFEKLCLIPYNVDMDNFAFCLNITMTQHNITFLFDNTCYKIPPNPTHIEGGNTGVGALEFDTEDVDVNEDDGDTEVDYVNEVDDATPFDDVISDDKKMDDKTLRFGTY